jgi:transcriptional regulator with XRE-family HTH domain
VKNPTAGNRYELLRTLLIEARKSAGLTQVDVADRLGRTQAYVSRYENGSRRLDVIELFEVADAIGFNPVTLLRKLHVELSGK